MFAFNYHSTRNVSLPPSHRDKSLYSMSPRVRFPCATLLVRYVRYGQEDGRKEEGGRCRLYKYMISNSPLSCILLACLKFTHKIYTNPVRTSQGTYYVYATKSNGLMLFKEQSLFIVRIIRNTYIQIQFVPHRKHIASPLQSPTG
jgi:hypothetical protein